LEALPNRLSNSLAEGADGCSRALTEATSTVVQSRQIAVIRRIGMGTMS
jgi:hypothetical protein